MLQAGREIRFAAWVMSNIYDHLQRTHAEVRTTAQGRSTL
jgi:hypothetical protein